MFGLENKDFLPNLDKNPSRFLKSLGLYVPVIIVFTLTFLEERRKVVGVGG